MAGSLAGTRNSRPSNSDTYLGFYSVSGAQMKNSFVVFVAFPICTVRHHSGRESSETVTPSGEAKFSFHRLWAGRDLASAVIRCF
jgi:hypothetical protein